MFKTTADTGLLSSWLHWVHCICCWSGNGKTNTDNVRSKRKPSSQLRDKWKPQNKSLFWCLTWCFLNSVSIFSEIWKYKKDKQQTANKSRWCTVSLHFGFTLTLKAPCDPALNHPQQGLHLFPQCSGHYMLPFRSQSFCRKAISKNRSLNSAPQWNQWTAGFQVSADIWCRRGERAPLLVISTQLPPLWTRPALTETLPPGFSCSGLWCRPGGLYI